MSVEHLRYDELCLKASHNSIDRGAAIRRGAAGDPGSERCAAIVEQLAGSGGLIEPCRALELDLVQADGRFQWTVKHGVRDDGPDLRDVLGAIAGWARAPENARHPVVTIHFDLKNAHLDHTDFATTFDAMLEEIFESKRIYGPGEVIGSHEDLVRGARNGGWAIFARLRGRFIFCLSGNSKRKTRYARHDPRARRCFADFPGSRGARRKGHRVFANLFVDAAGYPQSLDRYRRHPGFITRGYNIVTRRLWDLSVDRGLNLLSTDVLKDRDFSLGGDGYASLAR